jgi:hypothetical protein
MLAAIKGIGIEIVNPDGAGAMKDFSIAGAWLGVGAPPSVPMCSQEFHEFLSRDGGTRSAMRGDLEMGGKNINNALNVNATNNVNASNDVAAGRDSTAGRDVVATRNVSAGALLSGDTLQIGGATAPNLSVDTDGNLTASGQFAVAALVTNGGDLTTGGLTTELTSLRASQTMLSLPARTTLPTNAPIGTMVWARSGSGAGGELWVLDGPNASIGWKLVYPIPIPVSIRGYRRAVSAQPTIWMGSQSNVTVEAAAGNNTDKLVVSAAGDVRIEHSWRVAMSGAARGYAGLISRDRGGVVTVLEEGHYSYHSGYNFTFTISVFDTAQAGDKYFGTSYVEAGTSGYTYQWAISVHSV